MPLLLSFIGILCLILLIIWCRLDTFITFMLVSIGLGLASGLDITRIIAAIQKGIGSIMGSLVIILGFGAMLGRLIADSGAAQQITQSLVKLSGIRRIQWAMALSGFLVGLPMFYSAGFMVLIPLVYAVGAATELPLLYLGIPVLSALSVAHGFLPPHPSPTAIAQQLHANIGRTLLYGIIVAIPTIILAGILFGRTMRKYKSQPNTSLLKVQLMEPHQLPGLGLSLAVALMPLILLSATAVLGLIPGAGALKKGIDFIGDPSMDMLLSVLIGIWLLGLRRGKTMREVMRSLEDAFKGVAPVMLIIAGAGAFMQVIDRKSVV